MKKTNKFLHVNVLSHVIMIGCLFFSSCSVSIQGDPRLLFKDWDEINDDFEAELEAVKFNKNAYLKENKALIERAYNSSVHYKFCSQLNNDKIPKSGKRLLRDFLDIVIELEELAGIGQILFSEDLASLSSIYVDGDYLTNFKVAKKTKFQLDKDPFPNATAAYEKGLDPQISFNSGLLEAICKTTTPETTKDELVAFITSEAERLEDASSSGELAGFDLISSAMDGLVGVGFSEFDLQLSDREFVQAITFILAHEFAHILFDPSHAAALTELEIEEATKVTGQPLNSIRIKQLLRVNEEVRADLYGLFVMEALFGRNQLASSKQTEFQKKLGASWTQEELVLSEGDAAFEVFLRSIYGDIGLAEANKVAVHLSVEDRIEFLRHWNAKIGIKEE